MAADNSRWSLFTLAAIAAAAGLAFGLRVASSETPKDPDAIRAKAAIEEAVKKDPANAELWLHLGFAFKKLDDADGAQKAFEKVVELNPKSASAHYMLGLIYEKKKMKEQAIAAWKACLANATEDSMKEIAQKHLGHLQK